MLNRKVIGNMTGREGWRERGSRGKEKAGQAEGGKDMGARGGESRGYRLKALFSISGM